MLKKKETRQIKESIGNNVLRRSKFLHGLFSNFKYTVFNWSFIFAFIITITFYLFNHVIKHNAKDKVVIFMFKHSFDFLSISISAMSIILAAIAIIIVVFNKKQLTKIAKKDDRTFEGFIFPYRYSATLWGIIAVISITIEVIYIPKILIISYFWIFLLLYSILYTLYLIGEIIQIIWLSAMIGDN